MTIHRNLAFAAGLLGAVGLVYQAWGTARDRRRVPLPGRWVRAGGTTLHVLDRGAGLPVVVFESGIAASSISWSRVQPAVAAFTGTCSYDRPGFGWSFPARAPRTLPRMVEELREVLRAAGAPPPYVLVGHSFGGFIVSAFAAVHPDEVAGLVLVDTVHPEEWTELGADRQRLLRGGIFLSRVGAVLASLGIVRFCLAMLTGGRPRVARGFAGLFGPTTVAVLGRIVGEVQKLDPTQWPSVKAHWSQPKSFRAMADHLAALTASAEARRSGPPLPDVPLVVLSASAHEARLTALHRRLAESSSKGEHRVARHSGHWIHLDEPELVIDAIRRVVFSVRASEEDEQQHEEG